MFDIQFASIWPYFALMLLFGCEACLIQHLVPFYRSALRKEISNPSRAAELDGLRGLLALGVFFTHAQTFRQWVISGNWEAPSSNFYSQLSVAPVGMFFLITGFLFWTKVQRGTLGDLKSFFGQRVMRLFPAYLFACLLIALVVAKESQFHRYVPWSDVSKSAVSFMSFLLIPSGLPNGFKNAQLIYANVFWSLRLEWMFYLLLPLLSLFARTRLRQLLLVAIAFSSLFIAPRLLASNLRPVGLGTLYYFDFYFVSYFLVGMLISFLKESVDLKKLATSRGATVIAIVVTVLLMAFVPPKAGTLEGVILGFPLLLVAFGNSLFGLLRVRPLILLGQVSYSIYLLHGIVIFVAGSALRNHIRAWTPSVLWAFTAAEGVAVVLLSAFSYRYLEAPFMKGSYFSRSDRNIASPAMISTAEPATQPA